MFGLESISKKPARKSRKPKRGTTRTSFRKAQNKRRKGLLSVVLPWLSRFGLIAAVLTGLIWSGAWFFLSDADTKMAYWTQNKIVQASASMGFEIKDVLVDGRERSDPEILRAIINVQKGDPLFSFDPHAAQELVEQINWVDKAHIERRWPDTIYIKLEERVPFALYQKDKQLSLIDQYGTVIDVDSLTPFKDLIIVIGESAPENTAALFAELETVAQIFDRVEMAGFISKRRWDLILKSDTRVKLPENDVQSALERLAEAQENDQILEKDLKVIDLRDPTRMVVQTKPGAVREYQKGLSQVSAKSGKNI